MSETYQQLIDDHAQIAGVADRLLKGLAVKNPAATEIAHDMHQLAQVVKSHIESEEQIVGICDHRVLPAPWRAAFVDGKAHFEKLRHDWLAFLEDWPPTAIEFDIDGFRTDAVPILGRLTERLEIETRGLYSVALQTAVIVFK